MHHAEGNLLTDLSTTMPYRRDSFAHWLHYMVRFAIGSFTNFPRYFIQRGRTKMMRRWVAGEAAWAVLVLGAWWLNPLAATIVFIMPLVTIRTLFMCGNWGQHAFVDVNDANNPYRNSTCLLNHRYNRRCFNDGYHIVHHLRPAMHWAEMPKFFEAHWERFAAEDAIVFDGLGNNQTVWWCLMLGRYDKLAEHLVQWPGKERTMAERIAFLQSRTRGQRGRIRGIFEAGPVPAPKGRKPSGGEAVAA
jgi:fatty acid desaturase